MLKPLNWFYKSCIIFVSFESFGSLTNKGELLGIVEDEVVGVEFLKWLLITGEPVNWLGTNYEVVGEYEGLNLTIG